MRTNRLKQFISVISAQLNRRPAIIVVEVQTLTIYKNESVHCQYQFAKLHRATIVHSDNYLGDTISLMLFFSDGGAVKIAMDNPAWPNLVAVLDASGKLMDPAAQWQLQAIADGPEAPPHDLMLVK